MKQSLHSEAEGYSSSNAQLRSYLLQAESQAATASASLGQVSARETELSQTVQSVKLANALLWAEINERAAVAERVDGGNTAELAAMRKESEKLRSSNLVLKLDNGDKDRELAELRPTIDRFEDERGDAKHYLAERERTLTAEVTRLKKVIRQLEAQRKLDLEHHAFLLGEKEGSVADLLHIQRPVSYTHLTLPTNREV